MGEIVVVSSGKCSGKTLQSIRMQAKEGEKTFTPGYSIKLHSDIYSDIYLEINSGLVRQNVANISLSSNAGIN